MIFDRARSLTLLATAGAFGLTPGVSTAQSTPADSLRIPALLINVGAGGARDMGDWPEGGPVQVASAQFLVGRHLALEGEVTRWKTDVRNFRPIVTGFKEVWETDEGGRLGPISCSAPSHTAAFRDTAAAEHLSGSDISAKRSGDSDVGSPERLTAEGKTTPGAITSRHST